jgi:serine/threonine-protein kinase
LAVAAGTNINQYKVISRLGSGGMGEVYLAQDVRLGRKVALKLLYEDVKQGEDWVRRFEQEARATSSLNHPNIITIYEVGQSDGSHFISTEFIDGQTLRQHLKHNVMTLRDALDVAIQVATALATAHEAGIVHRDIKPENVMLRADGYVKVLDFGLAKFIEKRLLGLSASDPDAATQPFVNTNPGAVMGTVSYMSPEQARGQHVDARSDIFSLGILLYEMLTGRQPFEGTSASEVIISIVQKRPRPMARFAPDMPQEMERIVDKALNKNKEERYQTVKDMLIDLKRLKRRLETEEEIDVDDLETETSPRLLRSGDVARASSGQQQQQSFGQQQPSLNLAPTTAPVMTTPTLSSAEYIVNGIKQHKKVAFILVGVFVVAIVAYYYYVMTRPIDSIAVLPFSVVNPEPGTEQLSDDITAQVIDRFTGLPNLTVKSFNSVTRYKGQQPDPQQVGRDLNVRAILTGRITKRGDSYIIQVWLVNTRDGSNLLSVNLPTTFSDITLVSGNIVEAVSKHIDLKLSVEDEKKRQAESLYMKGRNAWNKRTGDAIKEASGYFSEALKLDPNYAPARAGLADCYNMLATYGVSAPKEAFPKAISEAEAALRLDNNLAEAHAALAYAKFRGEWNWRQAEQEFKESIRLNEKNASAHQWYASYLSAMGRSDEAIAETRRTQDLDKTSLIINSHFGLTYFFARRFDDAIAACQDTLKLDPNFFVARRYLGLAYAQKGMYKQALEQYDKALALSKNSALMRIERASVLARSDDSEDVEKARTELKELQEMSKQRYLSAYHIATIYVALKDRDRAFDWLEKAFTERADWMVFLNVDPRFESLRSDDRFKDLLRRMNLG